MDTDVEIKRLHTTSIWPFEILCMGRTCMLPSTEGVMGRIIGRCLWTNSVWDCESDADFRCVILGVNHGVIGGLKTSADSCLWRSHECAILDGKEFSLTYRG